MHVELPTIDERDFQLKPSAVPGEDVHAGAGVPNGAIQVWKATGLKVR
jgi:hypothetical protein